MTRGFSLVELLVVITIIVVLVSLLAPALDQAIYQAELASCGANLRAIGIGASTYAMEHGRAYPYREGVHYADVETRPYTIKQGVQNQEHDDRKYLRGYLALNKVLNDPLCRPMEIENADPASWIWLPYNLWFGWKYSFVPLNPRVQGGSDKGMFRVGDRWEFTHNGNQPSMSFRALAGDTWWTRSDQIDLISAHPDGDGLLAPEYVQNVANPAAAATYADPDFKMTFSRWSVFTASRKGGPIDLNYVMDDVSVLRIDRLAYDAYLGGDTRVERVSANSRSGQYPTNWMYVPR